MGGAALGAPGEQIKEGEEGVAGTTFDEPDAELRGPPPQPEGLREKGLYDALARPFGPRGFAPAIGFADSALFASRMVSGLHGVPAPRCALRLASNPFSLNATPSAYVDTLLECRIRTRGAGPRSR